MITNNTSYIKRAKLYGLSSDVKPTDLPNASTFLEIDTSKKYWYDAESSEWHLDKGSGSYTLPKASDTTLGGVKIGEGINIDSDGTISVGAQQNEIDIVHFSTEHGYIESSENFNNYFELYTDSSGSQNVRLKNPKTFFVDDYNNNMYICSYIEYDEFLDNCEIRCYRFKDVYSILNNGTIVVAGISIIFSLSSGSISLARNMDNINIADKTYVDKQIASAISNAIGGRY